MKIILASCSPRRRELIKKITAEFNVVPPSCEELTTEREPVHIVSQLACIKALDVFRGVVGNCVVIGCDTVVDVDGKVWGKPKSADDAKRMLSQLSGRTHLVHTGVCIVSEQAVSVFSDTTEVSFRNLTQEEIDSYVMSGSPMDKAGAYGIQDSGFVEKITGSRDNVMGFPTEKIRKELKHFN